MVQELLQGGATVTQQDTNAPDNNIGLYFDIIQEHSISIQNQITDNYLENNTAIQDHIAQAPIVVNLRGLKAEVVFSPPDSFVNQGLDKIGQYVPFASKLSAIPALYPPVSNVTQLAKDAALLIEQSVSRAVKIFKNLFGGSDNQTQLEKVYQQLMSLRTHNVALRVETPFKTFDNMFIQSLTLRQGDTNYITDIELSLKKIQFANVETSQPNEEVMEKYNAYARTQEANNGKAQGVEKDISLIKAGKYKINDFIGNLL